VERGAIRAKRRTPSVEHGVIRDRRDRKVRGPATRDLRLRAGCSKRGFGRRFDRADSIGARSDRDGATARTLAGEYG